MTKFTSDNTEGYSDDQLDELNELFAVAAAERGIDLSDADQIEAEKSTLDYVAERLLADYDDEHRQDSITVAVYAQQTRLAGQVCRDEDLIDRESDDVEIYRGTVAELLATADAMVASPTAGSRDHCRRVADAIRSEVA